MWRWVWDGWGVGEGRPGEGRTGREGEGKGEVWAASGLAWGGGQRGGRACVRAWARRAGGGVGAAAGARGAWRARGRRAGGRPLAGELPRAQPTPPLQWARGAATQGGRTHTRTLSCHLRCTRHGAAGVMGLVYVAVTLLHRRACNTHGKVHQTDM